MILTWHSRYNTAVVNLIRLSFKAKTASSVTVHLQEQRRGTVMLGDNRIYL